MPEEQVSKLAAASAMIVNGYAFDRLDGNVRAVNLRTGSAAVLLPDGTVSEASMDDIELDILQDIFRRNAKFMEADA